MPRPIALFLLLLPLPVIAQEKPLPQAESVDAIARAEFDRQRMVGMAVVVIDGERIAWSRGYGFADREAQIPVDPAKTQFRWASISKPVTAIAAMQLAEQGKLDVDADVRQYVPEFPDKGVKITSRQLLCHQGGIVHYENGPVVKTEREYDTPHPFADVVVALDTFKESPLVNPPGEKYSYTTHGYILLSAVVQRAGSQTFAEQVRERISGPLGMTDFRPDYQWEEIPNRAVGYLEEGDQILRRRSDDDPDVSWKLGGGGYTSPATDLARFGIGLLKGSLVSEATQREMWTVTRPKDPEGSRPYGLGFAITERPEGGRLIGHTGSQERTRTALLIDPATGQGVAVMTNSEWAEPMKVATDIMTAIRPR